MNNYLNWCISILVFYIISFSYISFYFSVKSDFKVYLPKFLETSWSSTSYFSIYPIISSVLWAYSILIISNYLFDFNKGDSNKFSKLFSINYWASFNLKNSELFFSSDILTSISSRLKSSLRMVFCYLFFSFICLCLFNNSSKKIILLFFWFFSI